MLDSGWNAADYLARIIDRFERGERVDFEAALKEYRRLRAVAEDDEENSR